MDKYERLKELKSLLDNRLLNQEEFNKLKNEILFSDDKINIDSSEDSITFTKAGGHKKGINESGKLNSERNIFEEIAIKNNQKTKYNIPQKNNNNLIYFAIFIGVLLFFFFQSNNNVVNDSNQNSSQDTTPTSSTDNYTESSSTICKVCGKSYTGDGYDKIDGVWQRNTNLQTELCSQNCAMVEDQKQNQKYNQILKKHGYAPINFDKNSTNSSSGGDYHMGNDGLIYENNKCQLCKGTGIETANNLMGGQDSRVCPMCDGRGVRTY